MPRSCRIPTITFSVNPQARNFMVGLNRHHGPTGASKFGLTDWATWPEFRELCALQGTRPRQGAAPIVAASAAGDVRISPFQP